VRAQLPVSNRIDTPVEIDHVVEFAGQEDRKYKIDVSGRGDYMNYLPTNKFAIKVDSAKVVSNGTVKDYFAGRIVSPMIWEYTDDYAFKGDLAMLDLIATSQWERPLYISTTVPSSQYKGLDRYFVQEGITYRVVPITTDKAEDGEFGMVDPHVMYDNMMNKYRWGNAEDPDVYLDETNKRMFSNYRRIFGSLGKSLLAAGDTTRAIEAARRGIGIVPAEKLPCDYFTIALAEVFYRAGQTEEGDRIIAEVVKYAKEYLDYAVAIYPSKQFGMDYPIGINMQALLDINNIAIDLKMEELEASMTADINRYYSVLYSGR
jgi:hypothetical protein